MLFLKPKVKCVEHFNYILQLWMQKNENQAKEKMSVMGNYWPLTSSCDSLGVLSFSMGFVGDLHFVVGTDVEWRFKLSDSRRLISSLQLTLSFGLDQKPTLLSEVKLFGKGPPLLPWPSRADLGSPPNSKCLLLSHGLIPGGRAGMRSARDRGCLAFIIDFNLMLSNSSSSSDSVNLTGNIQSYVYDRKVR